jgi:hypothetical protein
MIRLGAAMNTRMIAEAMGIAVLAGALAACGSSPASTATGHATASSPVPATAAPAQAASASVLAARMKAAGLPVGKLTVYTAASDPNHLLGRQGEYTSKVAWIDSRTISAGAGDPSADPGGIEFGGSIEVFANVADAAARAAYLADFKPPLGDGYDLAQGTAVLRLSNYLTPAQAQAYKMAFATAVG